MRSTRALLSEDVDVVQFLQVNLKPKTWRSPAASSPTGDDIRSHPAGRPSAGDDAVRVPFRALLTSTSTARQPPGSFILPFINQTATRPEWKYESDVFLLLIGRAFGLFGTRLRLSGQRRTRSHPMERERSGITRFFFLFTEMAFAGLDNGTSQRFGEMEPREDSRHGRTPPYACV